MARLNQQTGKTENDFPRTENEKIIMELSPASDGSVFVEQARKNLLKWGKQDLETLGLAIAEETGEPCQAILQARDEGGEIERIEQEAIDLGALCIQVLTFLKKPLPEQNASVKS